MLVKMSRISGLPVPARAVAVPALLAASAALLSGCLGSPTYGTDKTANQQLMEDVTGVLSLGPKDQPDIEYKPRPGIVMPSSTEVLPPPQKDVARSGDPAWPESPEERLARVRAEATANQDNPYYRSPVVRDMPEAPESAPASDRTESGVFKPGAAKTKRAEYLRKRAEATGMEPDTRRYLSEPPIDYRQPAAGAPAGELGKDEHVKEREAKSAARKKDGGGIGLGRLWPWGG